MMPEAVLDMIEPDAKAFYGSGDAGPDGDQLVTLASIAISLRHIADTLQPTTNHQTISDTLFYIEQRLGPQS